MAEALPYRAAIGANWQLTGHVRLCVPFRLGKLAWSPAAQGWRGRGRVTFCRSHPWWIAQHRAGLYRESRVVQPSSAQVRVSPKARTIGPAPAARRLPLRIGTAMLALFPHPSRANAARPRHTPPVGVAVVASGRLPPAGSSSGVVLGAVVGLGWLDVARRAQPHRGRSRGAGSPREPARSAAVDPARAVAWP